MVGLMRARCVDLAGRRVLLSRIAGSAQAADLTLAPNCGGLGRIRHFRWRTATGWPPNPLPSWPAARWLGRAPEAMTRSQVFQIGGCGMRCWYCYVPFGMLSGSQANAEWTTAERLVDLYAALPGRPAILDLSGGSPDIAPEWIAWTLQALRDRGLASATYLWSDDNLSADLLLRPEAAAHLSDLEAHGGYGRVCCLKGIDDRSFSYTTGCAPESFGRQLGILERYLDTRLDLYGYVMLVLPPGVDRRGAIRRLLDRVQRARSDFPGRIVPLRTESFSAMRGRLDPDRLRALAEQDENVSIWLDEIAARRLKPLWEELPA